MEDKAMSYDALLLRLRALERENAALREELRATGRAPHLTQQPQPSTSKAEVLPSTLSREAEPAVKSIDRFASPAEKITLFRSLFCGREDTYAKRWQSTKTGKAVTRRPAPMSGSPAYAQSQRETA